MRGRLAAVVFPGGAAGRRVRARVPALLVVVVGLVVCPFGLAGGVAVPAPAGAGAAAAPAAADECSGIPRCVSVPGPWVAVPGLGEVEYLLVCPGGKGIVGGTGALVSSQALQVSFDGIPGSPVAFGRTTNYEVLFRAVSGSHRPGLFEPFIGCIPTQSSQRNTTGVLPLGAPLVLRATSISPTAGATDAESLGCPQGERLVDSWTATAFAAQAPPAVSLAETVTTRTLVRRGVASATVAATGALPAAAHALVQLGVRCTPA
jgi:hypothetical protein